MVKIDETEQASYIPSMILDDLNARSRDIFRQIVETYLASGVPIGSRTLSRTRGMDLSPASIRNVMADMEEAGLLFSPHTSAGRIPTDLGLRLFVDGLMEVGDIASDDRKAIEAQCAVKGLRPEDMLSKATDLLSGLSRCTGMMLVPKKDVAIKQIEFVNIGEGRALVVLVQDNGDVENRIITIPLDVTPSTLMMATNYMNHHVRGRTLSELSDSIKNDITVRRNELDSLSQNVVEAGLAVWAGGANTPDTLIIRGMSNLLEDQSALENLERIRQLFDELETKEDLARMLELARSGEGVRIFIGAENTLFSLSGSSVIVAPYANEAGRIVGAVGVIGPTRLNYARIIPMVDYTAKMIGRLL